MAVLYHFPLDPHSRFVRLIMAELQMEATFEEERVHERRREFLSINPAGTIPVLVEHDGQVVPGAVVIAEYLDETRGLVLGDRRLLPDDPAGIFSVLIAFLADQGVLDHPVRSLKLPCPSTFPLPSVTGNAGEVQPARHTLTKKL